MKDIKLEQDVITSDGSTVGTVDRVIVHPDTFEVEGIVVEEGTLFTTDRIIDEEFIDRIDPDGAIYLNVTAEEEDKLPELASTRFVEADDRTIDRVAEMHRMVLPAAHGNVLVASEPVNREFAPAPDSPLEPAPTNSPPIVDRSNLPTGTITLEEGTEVLDINGEKLGSVHEIIYDAEDRISEIVIGEGLIFKHHVRVPADWIEILGHDHVVLSRTAKQAEEAGRID